MPAATNYQTVTNYTTNKGKAVEAGTFTLPYYGQVFSQAFPIVRPMTSEGSTYYRFYNNVNSLIFITDQSGYNQINTNPYDEGAPAVPA